MELEIHLELEEATPADLVRIEQELWAWCAANVVGKPALLPKPHCLRVDLGQQECIAALMDLQCRLYQCKAKIFIQFLHDQTG